MSEATSDPPVDPATTPLAEPSEGRPTTSAEIQSLVSDGGEHQPGWSFSACACGWQAEWPSDVRRLPQYIAHLVEVVTDA